jgi:hypothetical protein
MPDKEASFVLALTCRETQVHQKSVCGLTRELGVRHTEAVTGRPAGRLVAKSRDGRKLQPRC